MRTLVIGDIHGNYPALKQCLERSNFNYEEDQLICLGDVVDGHSQTYECVEELLKIKNLVLLVGNHDNFMMEYLLKGSAIGGWIHQGGIATVNSYLKAQGKKLLEIKSRLTNSNYTKEYAGWLNDFYMPVTHQELFDSAVLYHLQDNMLFVHGGINPDKPLHLQDKQTVIWDRLLIEDARNDPIEGYDKVFVGHTTTQTYGGEGYTLPRKFNNLWMVDTGAGWDGKLTIIDVNTEEYWQSDKFEGGR